MDRAELYGAWIDGSRCEPVCFNCHFISVSEKKGKEMIPKIIHYCWFGGKPLPKLAKKCIQSWEKYCPDYEIKRWDESNFDIDMFRYTREAYDCKKYAFVSDAARLWAMVTYGGIYMDTDVEVIKPLDEFLSVQAFSGFEKPEQIPTGIMGCEKGFPLFDDLLREYTDRAFIRSDGSFDMTTNVAYITKACLERGLVLNNEEQEVDGMHLYPMDWFCPKNGSTGEISETENTYTIHHFAGSWGTPKDRLKAKIRAAIGPKATKAVFAAKAWLRKRNIIK